MIGPTAGHGMWYFPCFYVYEADLLAVRYAHMDEWRGRKDTIVMSSRIVLTEGPR